ncbi:unnamed protein product [Caenorhabditis nigoni]
MSIDVNKLAEKTEHLSIDPVYDTNWCDMPDDIKLECIGKMELSERLSLRSTAKAERSLVDSQKIGFYRCDIQGHPLFHNVSLVSEDKITFSFKKRSNQFEFLKYIWKVGVFENLQISIYETGFKEDFLNYAGEISAKNIDFHCCNSELMINILQKMKNGVESIMMNARHPSNATRKVAADALHAVAGNASTIVVCVSQGIPPMFLGLNSGSFSFQHIFKNRVRKMILGYASPFIFDDFSIIMSAVFGARKRELWTDRKA